MAVNRVGTIDDRVKVTTVLLSVSDKSALETIARGVLAASPAAQFLSTGGTWSALNSLLGASASSTLRQVSAYTGQPEMQGGLVKTLDFKIYLGLLSETYNAAHPADLARTGVAAIDMVVVESLPLRADRRRRRSDPGDPPGETSTSAARAWCARRRRTFTAWRSSPIRRTTRPSRGELASQAGTLGLATRFSLARKAFRLIARYDAAISRYLAAPLPRAGRYAIRNGG